jgi:hypothetical protein
VARTRRRDQPQVAAGCPSRRRVGRESAAGDQLVGGKRPLRHRRGCPWAHHAGRQPSAAQDGGSCRLGAGYRARGRHVGRRNCYRRSRQWARAKDKLPRVWEQLGRSGQGTRAAAGTHAGTERGGR